MHMASTRDPFSPLVYFLITMIFPYYPKIMHMLTYTAALASSQHLLALFVHHLFQLEM